MSCGMEGLLLALRLATETVQIQPNPNGLSITHDVCGCDCIGSLSHRYYCMAKEAERDQMARERHNEKVSELQAIAKMCLGKSWVK